MYFPTFIAALAITVLLLYQTRTLALMRMGSKTPSQLPHYWGNWLYRFVHFILVILLGWVLLMQFPVRERLRTRGVIPVSYHSEQDMEFPELWGDWFAPSKKIIKMGETKEAVDGTEKPSVNSKNSMAFIKDDSTKALDAREGSGGAAAIGNELVFRAYSPAKLYWVMQIYDTYDGNLWTRSRSLLKGSNALDAYEPAEVFEVVQHISIEKGLSLRMPYAYKPKQAMMRDSFVDKNDGKSFSAILTKPDAISYVLKTHSLPPTPWRYRVQSFVPTPDLKQQPRAWNEPERNFGWNCRSVPRKVATKRLRKLAGDLTDNEQGAMNKANAIRDYLRNNFKYNLEVPAIPKNKETVDYFLFESRKGFCQHFAQAMVILARLSGLHARLVTGYSPGKYNVMANTFEVYEYHAHAWAQVFAEPYGWLTYDGVPPGEMRMGETNNLISSMFDPFGDTWSDAPPELSYRPPQAHYQTTKNKDQAAQKDNKKSEEAKPTKTQQLYDEVYEKAILDNNTLEPDAAQLLKAAIDVLKLRLKASTVAFISTVRDKAAEFASKCMAAAARAYSWLKTRTLADFFVAGVAFAVFCFIFNSRKSIAAFAKRRWRLFACMRLWRKIRRRGMDYAHRISACQRLNNELLELAAFKRPSRADILECAEHFPEAASVLMDDYTAVANAAFDSWYSPRKPSQAAAESAIEATERFIAQIRPFLDGKWKKGHA